MAQRIASLQSEAADLGRGLTGMRQAAIDATMPMQSAAADLARVGAAGQKTAADLAAAAQRIAPLAEAMNGAMRQLDEAERRLGNLCQSLDKALSNFNDLDASLGKVFSGLREGLSGFASQVTVFVNETNRDMAQAVGHLQGAVIELRETYEELPPRRPTR
jgi:ABC-type transporter Mla subunit MlaD